MDAIPRYKAIILKKGFHAKTLLVNSDEIHAHKCVFVRQLSNLTYVFISIYSSFCPFI